MKGVALQYSLLENISIDNTKNQNQCVLDYLTYELSQIFARKKCVRKSTKFLSCVCIFVSFVCIFGVCVRTLIASERMFFCKNMLAVCRHGVCCVHTTPSCVQTNAQNMHTKHVLCMHTPFVCIRRPCVHLLSAMQKFNCSKLC